MHPDFEQILYRPTEARGSLVRAEAGYPQMVETFGEPNSHDDDSKTDVAWDVRSAAGAVHIYNYKNGPTYWGEGTIEEIVGFSIQGESIEAVEVALKALNNAC